MKNSKAKGINPNDGYYQIPSKSQFPNSKTKEEKIYDIRERVFCFAQRVLEIAEKLPRNMVCDVLCTQLVKSGTSIGANVEEADGTVTKRDFINKITIARKEAVVLGFWICLILLVRIGIWDFLEL